MRGTIAAGDCLRVQFVPLDELRTGDVVAFRRGGRVRAHRVVAIRDGHWWTQGDGNWRRDSEPLVPEEVIGRVEEVQGPQGWRILDAGAQGLRRAAWGHAVAFIRWGILSLAAPFYHVLRATRIIRRLWRPDIQVVRFTAADGLRTKFIHRGQTVACWQVNPERWTCRAPYDLVVFPPAP